MTGQALSRNVLLRLGRVSNLPTVWTNVLAATVLAGADPASARTAVVLLSMTLFYVGGMYLNDAFDRQIDARERPERPIPAGEISAQAVFGAGFGMLGAGIALLSLLDVRAGLVGLVLAAAIVLYDLHHKGNLLSPVLMGICRGLVYLGTAAAVALSVPGAIVIAAAALLAHVAGLTYAAKQESLDRIERMWPLAVLALPLLLTLPAVTAGWVGATVWLLLAAANFVAIRDLRRRSTPGAVGRSVAALIAAISLLDAALAAPASSSVALLCVAGYVLTRLAQRIIPGT